MSSSGGSCTRARQSDTRWRMPTTARRAYVLRKPESPVAAADGERPDRPGRILSSDAIAAGVRDRTRAQSSRTIWNTMPTFGERPVHRLPQTVIVPAVCAQAGHHIEDGWSGRQRSADAWRRTPSAGCRGRSRRRLNTGPSPGSRSACRHPAADATVLHQVVAGGRFSREAVREVDVHVGLPP